MQYPTHPQYIVEHVYPKEKDRTLAGEYENLLLSCRPSDEEERNRKKAGKKERNSFFHCDKSKGPEVIPITPLQEDCMTHFMFDAYGGIQGDNEAQKDIDILNLNCQWLQNRRRAAIDGAIYDEDNNLLPDKELRQHLDNVMCLDADGNHSEFCFVIKNVIEGLLKPETDSDPYISYLRVILTSLKQLGKKKRFNRKLLKMKGYKGNCHTGRKQQKKVLE